MNAGPSSIPVELTHNYPFDSSNQLWGKAYGFNLQGGSCPDLVFVCFLQYYLVAHNSPTLTEPEEAGRNKNLQHHIQKYRFHIDLFTICLLQFGTGGLYAWIYSSDVIDDFALSKSKSITIYKSVTNHIKQIRKKGQTEGGIQGKLWRKCGNALPSSAAHRFLNKLTNI